MDFGLAKALRQLTFGMDFDYDSYAEEYEFTIGTSKIKCVKIREGTNEVGGFPLFCYVAEDDVVVVNRTHRFSLRKNREEVANCFVSTTEIYIAVMNMVEEMMNDGDEIAEYYPITFSETEDPRIVSDGEALFIDSPDILQISAECKLCGDKVEMRNVHVYHHSLFVLNDLY